MSAVRNTPVVRRLSTVRGPEEAINDGEPESGKASPRDQTSSPPRNGSVVGPLSSPAERVTTDANPGASGNAIGVEEAANGDGGGGLENLDTDHIAFMPYASSPTSEHRRVLTFVGVGAHPNSTSFRNPYTGGIYQRGRKRTIGEEDKEDEPLAGWYPHYLTSHTTGRNGQFFGLSRAEREHLGGVEYRAIVLLSWIVPIYFVLWQLLGCIGLGAYMNHNKSSTARENGIDPW